MQVAGRRAVKLAGPPQSSGTNRDHGQTITTTPGTAEKDAQVAAGSRAYSNSARNARRDTDFSETSGSHNALIVFCEIPFHRVMKLSAACASLSLPSCYLGVVGVNDAFCKWRRCLLHAFSWSVYISLNPFSPHTSPIHSLPPSLLSLTI